MNLVYCCCRLRWIWTNPDPRTRACSCLWAFDTSHLLNGRWLQMCFFLVSCDWLLGSRWNLPLPNDQQALPKTLSPTPSFTISKHWNCSLFSSRLLLVYCIVDHIPRVQEWAAPPWAYAESTLSVPQPWPNPKQNMPLPVQGHFPVRPVVLPVKLAMWPCHRGETIELSPQGPES